MLSDGKQPPASSELKKLRRSQTFRLLWKWEIGHNAESMNYKIRDSRLLILRVLSGL